MKRREFLVTSSQTALFTLTTGAVKLGSFLPIVEEQIPTDELVSRVAEIVREYDAQGNHRAGTEVDRASAEWLMNRARRLGAKAELESFPISRVDPQDCYLQIGDRRIDGLPLFDAGFTNAEGVRGSLGPLGSDAEIGLAELQPPPLMQLADDTHNVIAEIRHSSHKAVVLMTGGPVLGLCLANAPLFLKPAGPPTLQVSGMERDWLREKAAARSEIKFVGYVKRTAAEVLNVTAHISGSNPKLRPLVFSTPRSGWWQCASERGGGITCWLEVMRAIAAVKPARECLFVALSGHEIGELGIAPYLGRHKDLAKRAHAWVHFGANIGAPRQPNLIQAADDELEQWGAASMEKEGLTVNHRAPRNLRSAGEVNVVREAGGRYFALLCDSQVFHNVTDRWPEAVDVLLLSRYARAFSRGTMVLAEA